MKDDMKQRSPWRGLFCNNHQLYVHNSLITKAPSKNSNHFTLTVDVKSLFYVPKKINNPIWVIKLLFYFYVRVNQRSQTQKGFSVGTLTISALVT